MTTQEIRLTFKCDNCGTSWETRITTESEIALSADDWRDEVCECNHPCVGLTHEESDIWWEIVDAEETNLDPKTIMGPRESF